MFTLIVDNFGVEYLGDQHAHHLRDVIKKHYELTENWKGNLYAGINLEWNYSKCTCRLTMEEYIATVLFKYNHPMPKKHQLSPSKAAPIIYGAKTQLTPDEDTTTLLDKKASNESKASSEPCFTTPEQSTTSSSTH